MLLGSYKAITDTGKKTKQLRVFLNSTVHCVPNAKIKTFSVTVWIKKW